MSGEGRRAGAECLVHGEETAVGGCHAGLVDASLVEGEVLGLAIDVSLDGAVGIEAEDFLRHAVLLHRPRVVLGVVEEIGDFTRRGLHLVAVLQCGDGIVAAVLAHNLLCLADIGLYGVAA